MSAELFFPAVRAIQVLRSRVIAATATGGILEGLKYRNSLVKVEEGRDSLPYVTFYDMQWDETSILTGAQGLNNRKFSVSQGYTIRMMLSAPLGGGFLRMDPEDTSEPRGLLEWLLLLIDAIENPEGGVVGETAPDPLLCGTLARPIVCNLVRTDINQLSVSGIIELEMLSMNSDRGQRTMIT